MANNSFINTTILITRPLHQAQSLATKIQDRGGRAIMFPVITIAPPSPEELNQLEKIIQRFDQLNIVIFTSSNAVTYVAPIIKRYWFALPDNLLFFAIGTATQKALHQENFAHIKTPKQQFNSESLLSLPELDQVANKKVVIFSGYGGRELLLKELQNRGAVVSKVICYHRAVPLVKTTELQQILLPNTQQTPQQNIDYIVTTSNEGLTNLLAMADAASQAILLTKSLIVISKRMYGVATKLGFTKVILSENATDEAILSVIDRLA